VWRGDGVAGDLEDDAFFISILEKFVDELFYFFSLGFVGFGWFGSVYFAGKVGKEADKHQE
jgi:hypothetical protein